MHNGLTKLLTELEVATNPTEIKEITKRLTTLSISYQMAEISEDEAISNFEDLHKRSASEAEKEAIRFGFKCGLDCE